MAKYRRLPRKIIDSTGSGDFVNEDSGVVYQNRDGAQWEFWKWLVTKGEDGKPQAHLYRCDVPADVFKEHDWVDVEKLASFTGMSATELRALGRSDKIMARVQCLENIVDYHGPEELDSYPLVVSRTDIRKRWRGYKG